MRMMSFLMFSAAIEFLLEAPHAFSAARMHPASLAVQASVPSSAAASPELVPPAKANLPSAVTSKNYSAALARAPKDICP
jgi:hypothetical protein